MKKEKERKAHGVQLLVRAVVRDPDGKIIHDTGRKPSRSFVIQFLEFIGAMFDRVTTTATDTSGIERSIYESSVACINFFRATAPINVGTYGIQVGTGDTAEENTQFSLAAQLTEGTGAGNITHGAMVIGTAAVVGANVDLELKRTFTNNTGATITVKEAGMATCAWVAWNHLSIRDVLPAPVEVPDKCSITIYYTIQTTV